MLGFGPLRSAPLGAIPELRLVGPDIPTLVIQGIIIPDDQKIAEGKLLRSTTDIWGEIARVLSGDWSQTIILSPEQMEEMVAGAFEKAGYKVILTPRSATSAATSLPRWRWL